uniref:Uncharacterized protein n=1 Tax=Peronospora matthiolae TaxID=2874970 RepID=A0AAV1T0T1_9STRA
MASDLVPPVSTLLPSVNPSDTSGGHSKNKDVYLFLAQVRP